MSVHERLIKMRQVATRAEVVKQEEEEEAKRRKKEKYNAEIEQAKIAQAALLTDLRSKGVTSIIEEAADGREIDHRNVLSPYEDGASLPLSPEKRDKQLKKFLNRSPEEEVEFRKMVETAFKYREWDIHPLSAPFITDSGEWDTSLRIQLFRDAAYMRSTNRGFGLDTREETVNIQYNPDHRLSISGKNVTFDGPIPKNPQRMSTQIEQAIAKAMFEPNPPLPQNPSRRFDMNEPIF